jgi:hypothetical protein
MSPIITQRAFPKHPPFLRRHLGIPRPRVGAWALTGTSRHVRWALGIAAKFARRSLWPLLYTHEMTHCRASHVWIRRLQTVLRHTRGETRVLQAAPANQRNPQRNPLRAGQSAGMPAVQSLPSGLRQSAGQGIRKNLFVGWQRQLKDAQVSSPNRDRATGNRTVEFAKQVAPSRMTRKVMASQTTAASLTSAASHRVSPRQPQHGAQSDLAVGSVPERIIRKHRRVEERALARPGDPLATMVAANLPADTVISRPQHARLRQPQESRTPIENGPRDRTSSPVSNVNVAQITEAVLQQLDRRLIAARERMGRI